MDRQADGRMHGRNDGWTDDGQTELTKTIYSFGILRAGV